jgi:uncharacterized membrane protein
MINKLLIVALLTLIPTLELRAGIPYGFLALINVPNGWVYVVIVSIITNILLGPIVYFMLDKFVHLLRKIRFMDKIYQRKVAHIHKKIFPKTETYGDIALAFFIGIPLPGTGSYTGALAAYILGIKPKRFFWINIIGVLVAGIIVTVVMLSGSTLFSIFIKNIIK